MSSHKVEAINIRVTPMGEADKIVTLFSREEGKIGAIAKSARKPGSKFGGRLEIFAHNNYFLGKGRNLDIISQCENIENFRSLREDHDKLSLGITLIKLLTLFLEEGHKNPELFDVFLGSLRLVEKGIPSIIVVSIFQIKLLSVEGLFPILDHCVKCNKKITKKPKQIKFSSDVGGLICTDCSKNYLLWKEIDYSLIELALHLRSLEFNSLISFENILSFGKLNSMLLSYISFQTGKDISYWNDPLKVNQSQ